MRVSSSLQSAIQQRLSFKSPNNDIAFFPVGGGSINQTYKIEVGDKSSFCKINSASKFPNLFKKEQSGLKTIAKQNVITTPGIIDCFEQDNNQVLLLEWIEEGERTEAFWQGFGQQLAALHQQRSTTFGLEEANYMGSVPQNNRQQANWCGFFQQERIQPLIKLCYQNGLIGSRHLHQFENLYTKLDSIFEAERPSLLHGDLWSGNFMCNRANQPVLIDPATYYGHRSMDLALTTLFGGFNTTFYEAYHYHFSLPHNYKEQWAVCNLYPLLIHLYLFGSSYVSQIEATLKRFG